MIFPLWKFWEYSPLGFCAAVVWNCSEIVGIPCPKAPIVFGLIIGRKPHPNTGREQ